MINLWEGWVIDPSKDFQKAMADAMMEKIYRHYESTTCLDEKAIKQHMKLSLSLRREQWT